MATCSERSSSDAERRYATKRGLVLASVPSIAQQQSAVMLRSPTQLRHSSRLQNNRVRNVKVSCALSTAEAGY
jgi:hypothetical protein